jgi:hypothetical protein
MSDRGRGSIGSYVGNVVYNIVALGMMSTVSGSCTQSHLTLELAGDLKKSRHHRH